MRLACQISLLIRSACLSCAWAALTADTAVAAADPAAMCDQAARQASQETNVPLEVLRAITRTETGRGTEASLEPWPWTVNMEGKGVWFDTAPQAQRYVFRHFRDGARSFDVGCFQINYKWHGQAFRSIEEMFDPVLNARYAARFLGELHDEFGDWTAAVGAYHSRTHKHATVYVERYKAVRAALDRTNQIFPQATPRRNGYALLQGGPGASVPGSLVPQGQSTARSLFATQEEG